MIKMKLLFAVLFTTIVLLIGVGIWLWTPDKSRRELEARYLGGPGDLPEIAGMQLHVRDNGRKDAPALILLHGFGSSLHTWEPWARELSSDYRVLRFDMPGAGLSGPDPTGDYSDARGIEVLTALMDHFGIAKASLIGNSMGGKIAWKFAVAFPDRIDRLVLISPDGFASPGQEYGTRQPVPAMVRLMRYALPKLLLKMNLDPAYGDPARLTDDIVTRYHDLLLGPGNRDAMIASMEQTELVEPEPLLRSIKARTLLLWGDKDAMIPLANAEDYVKVLPNSTLTVLPGLGHLPQEEAPETSLVPVKEFLAANRQ
jgi:pimeloyl-ACP methyl ester carboxylesterase